ncbi:MGMT family protein [Vibrio natriegens]|nr:MGMT family protein [Vibrio natriegens]UYI47688.1 MGMT family protein [Vibrio natriegens]
MDVLIPCHRVLRGDGSLGRYPWELEREQVILDVERKRRIG